MCVCLFVCVSMNMYVCVCVISLMFPVSIIGRVSEHHFLAFSLPTPLHAYVSPDARPRHRAPEMQQAIQYKGVVCSEGKDEVDKSKLTTAPSSFISCYKNGKSQVRRTLLVIFSSLPLFPRFRSFSQSMSSGC